MKRKSEIIDWKLLSYGLNEEIDKSIILYGASRSREKAIILLESLGLSNKQIKMFTKSM